MTTNLKPCPILDTDKLASTMDLKKREYYDNQGLGVKGQGIAFGAIEWGASQALDAVDEALKDCTRTFTQEDVVTARKAFEAAYNKKDETVFNSIKAALEALGKVEG